MNGRGITRSQLRPASSLALWLSGSLALWLSGSLALWLSGSLALWLSGSLALWLSGSLALWLSGSLAQIKTSHKIIVPHTGLESREKFAFSATPPYP